MNRRDFLKFSGASLVLWPSASALATTAVVKPKKLVFVMLRGALDSLHTIIPVNDKALHQHRPKLVAVAEKKALSLNTQFALHPSLQTLHRWYRQKTMLPIVAVGSGYDARSHFDGQDFLESGLNKIDHDTGWLGRAIDIQRKSGLAVSQTTPIVFRSAKDVNTWYPTNLKSADEDIYNDLINLYQNDPKLLTKLQEGMETKALVGSKNDKKKNQDKFVSLARSCGQLLNTKGGPDCAMLELGGWDTHNNQANRLTRKLAELDNGLNALESALKETWNDTVVVIATEFGRTVRENGTGGTDHGTASCMFVAGGAVKGGKVLGEWPGLAPEQLFENRDLQPTSSAFSWMSALLSEHWQMSPDQLAKVFPGNSPYPARLLKSYAILN
ncbi:DUF1501 domain-containing protein [Psychrosphaera sp. B3R10]|uniref:DUF1501 domain-containing protein n=1 Tax=unclassified Psychrosphaera TaxID=2641570 RepID=UPI001C08646E|nr:MULTISPECIES: DUF1501 domain-containing protein [unclassified Psychrosphaera]MBU2880843.1 DUF1501 domain-containing protein [Psychrosphaera sp. I2R16]MBU2990938.1 DUF1501 domain-containing protein [Psychrosphaera sp. B3R10]